MIRRFFRWIRGWFNKEIELDWPSDFLMIDYSSPALNIGVKKDRNKIIYRKFINKYNQPEIKKYFYSQERLFSLQKSHKIPVYDKTRKDIRLPVFSRVLPGEVHFLSR